MRFIDHPLLDSLARGLGVNASRPILFFSRKRAGFRVAALTSAENRRIGGENMVWAQAAAAL